MLVPKWQVWCVRSLCGRRFVEVVVLALGCVVGVVGEVRMWLVLVCAV